MSTDSQLLSDYARSNSQEAFGELVKRYVDLVYSAALRQVGGDAHLAQDVAQTVFTDLARKAASLARLPSLSGWLYTSARFAASNVARGESRRRQREEIFMLESTHESVPEADWDSLRPVLDDVMHELKPPDREAILLRYFQNRPFAEIGAKLGLNENAARMRVDRALTQLQTALARRGIATSAALAAVISAHAVQIAPAGLAATLTAASVATAGTTSLTLLTLMTASKVKLGIGALLLAGATTTVVLQYQAQARLRTENESLRQQITQLNADIEKRPTQPVVADDPLPDDQKRELLRLRGEVGVLRRQTNELLRSAAGAQAGLARNLASDPDPQAASSLPEEYPKTPDGATKGIFEVWARGDFNAFFTNFAEPGVPREMYDKLFGDPAISNLMAGLEVVSVGTPTNSFGPNMYFVPYKIRFKDGSEKEWRLHVAQDPKSQRWYFKGGF